MTTRFKDWVAGLTSASAFDGTELIAVDQTTTKKSTLATLAAWVIQTYKGFTPSGTGATTRTVQAKEREIVSLTDFGADGTSANDNTAWTNALATGASIYVPDGTWLVSSAQTIAAQGQGIYGSGFLQSVIQRASDSTFVMFNVTSTSGNDFRDFYVNESSAAYTNTGSYFELPISGGTDVNFSRVWFHNGWQHVRCLAGTSNVTWDGCVFEAARKGAIYSSSSGRNKVVGSTFWKNSADSSNPSDRGYAIRLEKNGSYAFGSYNWNIVGNYFAENVYGPFISSNTSEGLQIVGNFFEICSQVDNGQKSDIELTADTYVSIVGNTSNSVVNSYIAGQRGAKYCVDVAASCSTVTIVGNTFQAGVTGTINDPGGVCTVLGNPGVTDSVLTGIKVGNSAQADANTLDYYQEGTWTPVLNFGGAHTGQTYTTQLGTYTRIGRLVTVSCLLAISAKGSSTGVATIAGLPFASASGVTQAVIVTTDGGVTVTGQVTLVNLGTATAFALYPLNNGSVGTQLNDTAFTTPTFRFVMQYEV